MLRHINWRIALPVLGLGAAAIVVGAIISTSKQDALSSVVIEIGIAIFLITFLVMLERQLVRDVGQRLEKTATDVLGRAKEETANVVERATAELSERITRLEDLDRAQVSERSRRHQEKEQLIKNVIDGELGASMVCELLATGFSDRLLDPTGFKVRTGEDSNCHVLYLLSDLSSEPRVLLDFVSFEDDMARDFDSSDIAEIYTSASLSISTSDSTVEWTGDKDLAWVANELEAALERENKPLNGFQFRYALESLANSVQVMRVARTAEANSPLRMRGELQLLINDGWAITSYGLEAIKEPAAFEADWAGFKGGPPAALFRPASVAIDPPNVVGDEGLWFDTIRWITQRENWQLTESGEDVALRKSLYLE